MTNVVTQRNVCFLMKIITLINQFEPGGSVSVLNEPFAFKGKAEFTLDGGETRHWIFNDEAVMLSLNPKDEELVLFEALDEELEPDTDIILYQGKEYEFSYEDAGTVSHVEGEVPLDEEERYMFTDYESDAGELVRLVKNDNTGEVKTYHGRVLSEDDIASL